MPFPRLPAIVLMGAALAILASGCISGMLTVRESFENGMADWTVGKDVPIDPNTGDPVNASASVTDVRARTGSKALLLTIDGRQDDGTVWVQVHILMGAASARNIETVFYVYSEVESFNVLAEVVAYAGVSQPNAETDFEKLGQADPAVGWNRFELTQEVEADAGDSIYVAVGITVAWETILEYEFDDVRITVS